MNPPLVVGLGSHHGDDQAGWLVLDRLREQKYPADRLLRIQHPIDLLDDADPRRPLIICDACQGAGTARVISRWQWPSDQIATTRHSGSHDLSLREVLELGRELDRLPGQVEIWGIEGSNWSPGDVPSSMVEQAAVEVADMLLKEHGDA